MEQGKSNFKREDLKLFLEETDEHLRLLDNDIVRLEQEAGNVDLLQEIFRAAHTLKGSSAMLGLEKMADLTHAMEDLLDRIRKGTQAVTSEIVDSLLQGLDTLKVLKEDAAAGRESEIDVTELAARLRSAGGASAAMPAPDAAASPSQPAPETAHASLDSIIAQDQAALDVLRAAPEGQNAYRVRVSLAESCEWLAVRCFQILDVLGTFGHVVASVPSRQDVEAEKGAREFEAVLLSSLAAEQVAVDVQAIDEVREATVEAWRGLPAETAPAETPAQAEATPTAPVAPDSSPAAQAKAMPAAPALPPEPASTKIEVLQTVRVDVNRLDDLMNMVGELVIEGTRLNEIMGNLLSTYHDDVNVQGLAVSGGHLLKVLDPSNDW